jgi:HD-like signal output (HDOD) protein
LRPAFTAEDMDADKDTRALEYRASAEVPSRLNVPLPTEFVRQITRLDPMPMTAQRLMRALQDERVGPAAIAGYVQFDPAIASGVLRLANSAAFGGVATVNLREAIVRVGTSKLVEMVLGDTLQRMKAGVPMYGLDENELWRHSAAASLAVTALRQEKPSANVPESASIAALLHHIGKLVMGRFMQADMSLILERCRDR